MIGCVTYRHPMPPERDRPGVPELPEPRHGPPGWLYVLLLLAAMAALFGLGMLLGALL